MLGFLSRFRTDEAGATAMEYALIAALISIAITTAIGLVSQSLLAIFLQVQNAFPA